MRGISTLHKNALLAREVEETLFLALTVVPPVPADTGATIQEASFAGYVRAEVAPSSWTTPENGVMRTNAPIAFPALSSGSTTIVGWALLTALSGGQLRWLGEMTPRVIDLDDPVFTVASGALALSFADLV
jgi:hypothetical protein